MTSKIYRDKLDYNFVRVSINNIHCSSDFIITNLFGNCGTLLLSNLSGGVFTSIPRLELAKFLRELFYNDLVLQFYSTRNILMFTDALHGHWDYMVKYLLPKKSWTDETVMGVNDNSGNMLVVRYISKQELNDIIKEEEDLLDIKEEENKVVISQPLPF